MAKPAKPARFVGLDVHKDSIAVAVAEEGDSVRSNHQGIGNELVDGTEPLPFDAGGPVLRKERLGGMLSYYHRDAA